MNHLVPKNLIEAIIELLSVWVVVHSCWKNLYLFSPCRLKKFARVRTYFIRKEEGSDYSRRIESMPDTPYVNFNVMLQHVVY